MFNIPVPLPTQKFMTWPASLCGGKWRVTESGAYELLDSRKKYCHGYTFSTPEGAVGISNPKNEDKLIETFDNIEDAFRWIETRTMMLGGAK